MPAKDKIHDHVKNALTKAGWIITHDPYTVEYETDKVYADLAAERVIAATKGSEKILVEIKSFIGASIIQDFKEAYGQYMLYFDALVDMGSEYKLHLALSDTVYEVIQERPLIMLSLQRNAIPLIIVDIGLEEVIEWIN